MVQVHGECSRCRRTGLLNGSYPLGVCNRCNPPVPTWPRGMQGFRSAILGNPADDTPRLVAADWMDENGYGGWAHAIRRGCHERRPVTLKDGEPAKVRLDWPEYGTVDVHLDVGTPGVAYILDRGFVGGLRMRCEFYRRHMYGLAGLLSQLFSLHPIRAVEFDDDYSLIHEIEFQDGRSRWAIRKTNNGDQDNPSRLPPGLFAFLPLVREACASGHVEAAYTTRERAAADLSAAATDYGRALAGFPPLGLGAADGLVAQA